jgi:hypothetical protein
MPRRAARANAAKSALRAHVEHPLAQQKGIMGLVIRPLGLARAKAAVTPANIGHNRKRWCWLDGSGAAA